MLRPPARFFRSGTSSSINASSLSRRSRQPRSSGSMRSVSCSPSKIMRSRIASTKSCSASFVRPCLSAMAASSGAFGPFVRSRREQDCWSMPVLEESLFSDSEASTGTDCEAGPGPTTRHRLPPRPWRTLREKPCSVFRCCAFRPRPPRTLREKCVLSSCVLPSGREVRPPASSNFPLHPSNFFRAWLPQGDRLSNQLKINKLSNHATEERLLSRSSETEHNS